MFYILRIHIENNKSSAFPIFNLADMCVNLTPEHVKTKYHHTTHILECWKKPDYEMSPPPGG